MSYGATSSDSSALTPSSSLSSISPTPANHGPIPSAGWDFVFAFRAPSSVDTADTPKQRRADAARFAVLNDLANASFSYSQLWLPADRRYFIRIALPQSTMMLKAQAYGLQLRVRANFGGGYLPFKVENAHNFINQDRVDVGLPYFTPAQRNIITRAVLRSREDWGVDLNLHALFASHALKLSYALHSRHERNVLLHATVYDKWWRPLRELPLTALLEYFGSGIAMYFAWIFFYSRMLFGLSALGAVAQAFVTWSWSHEIVEWARLSFGLALICWCTYWMRMWSRRNAVLAVRWGLEFGSRIPGGAAADDVAENDLRDDFRGVDKHGFYSRGGFVHLEDLSASTTRQPDRPARPVGGERDSAVDEERSGEGEDGPVVSTLEMRSTERAPLAMFAGVEPNEVDVEGVTGDDNRGSRSNANNDSSRHGEGDGSLARADSIQALFIGGGRDDDMRVYEPITGIVVDDLPVHPYSSRNERRKRMMQSSLITLVFSVVVGALSFCLLFYKHTINLFVGMHRDSGIVVGVMTAVLIISADNWWRVYSMNLTKWENHYTNAQFENSLLRKRFAFQFVSSKLSPRVRNIACAFQDTFCGQYGWPPCAVLTPPCVSVRVFLTVLLRDSVLSFYVCPFPTYPCPEQTTCRSSTLHS